MPLRSRVLALAVAGTATLGLGIAAAGSAAASNTPLPAYPATTTLDLGSPYCVTDDVIMNDPLDSTSPIVDTAGNTGAGSPVVHSQADPPITYSMEYLDNTTNAWVTTGPPPGTQLNPNTGELAALSGPGGDAPYKGAPWISSAFPAVAGTNSYTVRDKGTDSLKASGVEQYQVTVNDSPGSVGPPAVAEVTTVTYKGNTFNNANGALTIQLNGGSTTSTQLTLAAVASSLNIPNVGNQGSTPVTFALVGSPGWTLNNNVLTGTNAADPEIKATTPDGDAVFFTLSGISTTSGGVFYENNDANPCVGGTPVPAPAPIPTGTSTSAPPAGVTGHVGEISSFTDYGYSCLDNSNYTWANGNPLQLWRCGAAGGVDQKFAFATVGGTQVLEAIAPAGKPQGPWCVTDNGNRQRLTITSCTGSTSQQVTKHGAYYEFADSNVMNDAGWSVANGSWVIAWPAVHTRNERWSNP